MQDFRKEEAAHLPVEKYKLYLADTTTLAKILI